MEKNVVILDLKEYNRLRDFEKNIKSGKRLTENYSNSLFNMSSTAADYYTDDEIAEKLHENNKKLKDQLDKVIEEKDQLIQQNDTMFKSFTDLAKKNIFKIWKWKIDINKATKK
jgi:hypothetical protein